MTQAGRAATPYVFVSSTAEDLTLYRAAARDAAIGAELMPKMMEYFVAQGDKPPLPVCLAKVSEADVVVVIVAHRYGWVPPDQMPGERKSITWLECERAVAEGKEVLAFLIADAAPWPEEQKEEHEITRAVREGRGTPDLLASVQDRVVHLREFKKWLNAHGVRQSFVSPEDLRGKVSDSLQDWQRRQRRTGAADARRVVPPADPTRYLRALLARTAFINIRGLQVGTGRAHRFPIEDLFISLTTTLAPRRDGKATRKGQPADEAGLERPAPVPLHAALSESRLIAVGDPGSGKTTFLHRIAHALCETLLGTDPDAARARVGIEDRPFPMLVRLSDLATYLDSHRGARGAPVGPELAGWLPHFLAALSRDEEWDLDEDFFRAQLQRPCVVLLDGLDEAPGRIARESLSRLIENVASGYPAARIVVTSRPGAYVGEAVLQGFAHVQIDPLDERCGAHVPGALVPGALPRERGGGDQAPARAGDRTRAAGDRPHGPQPGRAHGARRGALERAAAARAAGRSVRVGHQMAGAAARAAPGSADGRAVRRSAAGAGAGDAGSSRWARRPGFQALGGRGDRSRVPGASGARARRGSREVSRSGGTRQRHRGRARQRAALLASHVPGVSRRQGDRRPFRG